jgi:hypothetical protein
MLAAHAGRCWRRSRTGDASEAIRTVLGRAKYGALIVSETVREGRFWGSNLGSGAGRNGAMKAPSQDSERPPGWGDERSLGSSGER